MGICCPKCGNEIKEGAGFCSSCGATVVQPPVMPAEQTPVEQPTPTEPEPLQVSSDTLPDQQYGQTQAYVPPAQQSKKSKTGLIIALVLIIVAVVVIAIVLLFVFQGGLSGSEGDLVGSWKYDSGYGISMTYTFNSDKTLGIETMGYTVEAGTWSVSNGKLCLDYLSSYSGGTDICYDYSLSGNQLTLSYQGIEVMKLTKS